MDSNQKAISSVKPKVDAILELETEISAKSEDELRNRVEEMKESLRKKVEQIPYKARMPLANEDFSKYQKIEKEIFNSKIFVSKSTQTYPICYNASPDFL